MSTRWRVCWCVGASTSIRSCGLLQIIINILILWWWSFVLHLSFGSWHPATMTTMTTTMATNTANDNEKPDRRYNRPKQLAVVCQATIVPTIILPFRSYFSLICFRIKQKWYFRFTFCSVFMFIFCIALLLSLSHSVVDSFDYHCHYKTAMFPTKKIN